MLLLMMMLTATTAWADVTGSGTEGDPYVVTTWGDLKDKMAAGGYIRLDANVSDPDKTSSSYLSVPQDVTVTLDLNGHTIDRGLTEATANGYVINVAGTLTVNDSSNPSTGTITGGNATDEGGGVYVVENGTFTMTGGTIFGNSAKWAGGVDVRGTFTMSGGTISGNTARVGGGVSVALSGAFTMSGGSITGNTATNYGGGVLVDMSDLFTVSGSAFVSGNTRSDGSANNVYIYCATINVSNLTADASIGVTTATEPTASSPVTFATEVSTADAAHFFGDDPAFAVDFTDGDLRLIKRTTAWDLLQAQLDAGGTVTLTDDVTATAHDVTLTVTNEVTLDLNGHTIDADRRFGVIEIRSGGDLTLTNSAEGAGTITGGTDSDYGGGVYVYANGAFTMTGGTISGNTSSVGGGVYVEWGGAFTMTGGTISGNSAYWAGGVEVYGAFTMSGGSITGNVADNYGGGVLVDGTFTVSGSPVIFGNTDSEGAASNVYLPNGSSIAVNNLTTGASIGVTLETYDHTFTSGYGTNNSADPADFFHMDDGIRTATLKNNEVYPGIAYIDADGTQQRCIDFTVLTGGGATTLSGGWYVVNSNITYTGTITLTGDVNIILCDGKTMSVAPSEPSYGIFGGNSDNDDNHSLAIYGQTTGDGTLAITTTSEGEPGEENFKAGNAIQVSGYAQHGGIVTINACGSWTSGLYAGGLYGNITITGGTTTINAGTNADAKVSIGIGVYGTLNISGGTVNVNASGEEGSYGISVFGTLNITGGNVTVTGGTYGIDTDGTINLSWTSASDRIYASSYHIASGTISIADGKSFYNGSEVLSGTITDMTKLNGMTLIGVNVLQDAAANDIAALATSLNGKQTNVTLQGRTLTKDGYWNTLCLPFGLASLTGTPLEGATIKQLDADNSNLANDGTLTLSFSDNQTAIEAGKPYIVRWGTPQAPIGGAISNPVFTGVTISSTAPTAVEFAIANSDDKCQFVGQYSPFSIVANDAVLGENQGYLNEIIMLGANNTLGYSKNNRTLRSFRAHFYVPTNGSEPAARSFVINFDDESTGINLTPDPSPRGEGSKYYTLDGRKLDEKPTTKGLYIYNGKKVVIK